MSNVSPGPLRIPGRFVHMLVGPFRVPLLRRNFVRAVIAISCVATFVSLAASAIAGESAELARGMAPQHPQQPQVAVDSQGVIHVVFGVGNSLRYCRSDDVGKTFTSPVELPALNVLSLGMRRGPRIAALDSVLCVTVVSGKQGKGRDGDVLALSSTDGGQTWTGPVAVNDAADSAREGLHAMAAGPGGALSCVWLDLRNRRSEVMASTSMNGGKTWSQNTLVYQSPDGSVCQCCHPSVAYDPQGRVFVLWRNSLAGARDMYVASSADGITYGKATKLGSGSWPLDACPMDGGAIAAIAAGKIATVWRREQDVFLMVDGQREERRLGVGEQPWIAPTDRGPVVVWLSKRGQAAMLLPPGGSPVELAARAYDPVIASGPEGRGPVVVAWETRDGMESTIQCRVVADAK